MIAFTIAIFIDKFFKTFYNDNVTIITLGENNGNV